MRSGGGGVHAAPTERAAPQPRSMPQDEEAYVSLRAARSEHTLSRVGEREIGETERAAQMHMQTHARLPASHTHLWAGR